MYLIQLLLLLTMTVVLYYCTLALISEINKTVPEREVADRNRGDPEKTQAFGMNNNYIKATADLYPKPREKI